jgi:hypothetical protein
LARHAEQAGVLHGGNLTARIKCASHHQKTDTLVCPFTVQSVFHRCGEKYGFMRRQHASSERYRLNAGLE